MTHKDLLQAFVMKLISQEAVMALALTARVIAVRANSDCGRRRIFLARKRQGRAARVPARAPTEPEESALAIGTEHVALTPDRADEMRVGWVGFNLAAQSRYAHVDTAIER